MRKLLIAGVMALGALSGSLLAVPAQAQGNTTGLVVTTCGSPPSAFVAGRPGPFTLDTTGTLCSQAGGGGGGAVTIADGADVTQGALADAASSAGGTGSVSAKLRLMTTQLGTINTTLGTPFQSGGSIGNTAFGATQSGTWTVQPGNTANTTPWLATINQGGNSAVVKAGSTRPTASDPSLVVSLSPNVGGIAPVVSSALESNHVIKAGSGILVSGYVTTGAVAGYLLVSDSTTAPSAGGAAIAPIACVYAPANATTSIGGQGGPAIIASTGITLVFSTSGCLTNTASATVFLSGQAL